MNQKQISEALAVAKKSASARTAGDTKRASTFGEQALSLVGLGSAKSNLEAIETAVYNSPDWGNCLTALLDIQQHSLSRQHPVILRTLEGLVMRWSGWQSDYRELLGLVYERLISCRMSADDADDQEIADLLFNYADHLAAAGKNTEAQNYLSRVVRIRKRQAELLPNQGLNYAQALTRLGCLLLTNDSPELAAPNLELALDLLEPTNSRIKMHAFQDLGQVYAALMRHEEAEQIYLKALNMRGSDVNSTIGCMVGLGAIYFYSCRLDDALALWDLAETVESDPNWKLPTFNMQRNWDDSTEKSRNPLLEIFELMHRRYGAEKARRNCRDMIVKKFSWAVPTESALSLIAEYSPVVEIGAGSGYWAKLLQERGVEIIAYDSHPVEGGRNFFFPKQTSWTEVVGGNEQDAASHSRHTLFLCWPPKHHPMAASALRSYSGKSVIYVGEESGGCTAGDDFFELLQKKWRLTRTLELPRWNMVKDSLFVYTRK